MPLDKQTNQVSCPDSSNTTNSITDLSSDQISSLASLWPKIVPNAQDLGLESLTSRNDILTRRRFNSKKLRRGQLRGNKFKIFVNLTRNDKSETRNEENEDITVEEMLEKIRKKDKNI